MKFIKWLLRVFLWFIISLFILNHIGQIINIMPILPDFFVVSEKWYPYFIVIFSFIIGISLNSNKIKLRFKLWYYLSYYIVLLIIWLFNFIIHIIGLFPSVIINIHNEIFASVYFLLAIIISAFYFLITIDNVYFG
jgi:hypothetical protein